MPMLHAWQADLTAAHPAHGATLSAAELARQARLRTSALQTTYGRAHCFLRLVLSQYTSLAASELAFDVEAQGKPTLPGSGLHFNLSYRPGRALLAVSDSGPVGADIEALTPLADAAALVQALFTPAEQAALRATAPAEYWPLFYTIWTRKEAYAKALGRGLAFANFSGLDFPPGAPLTLTTPAGVGLHSFAAGPGYWGAVAALSAGLGLPLRQLAYPADLSLIKG